MSRNLFGMGYGESEGTERQRSRSLGSRGIGGVTGVKGKKSDGPEGTEDTTAVTDSDLVEYLDGMADTTTQCRVLTAALRDPAVRTRISALRRLDQFAAEFEASAAPLEREQEQRLGFAVRRLVQEVAEQYQATAPEATEAGKTQEMPRSLLAELQAILTAEAGNGRKIGGGLWNVAERSAEGLQSFWDRVNSSASRALIAGRHALTLPCLAPAAAASAADLQLRRETITTADGVRIEFQQLPGTGASRLRVFVDASLLAPEVRELGYNVAFLTLEDGGAMNTAPIVQPPDRHILIVALNDEGRGFTDFFVGDAARTSQSVLPAPAGVCRLTGITLSHIAVG